MPNVVHILMWRITTIYYTHPICENINSRKSTSIRAEFSQSTIAQSTMIHHRHRRNFLQAHQNRLPRRTHVFSRQVSKSSSTRDDAGLRHGRRSELIVLLRRTRARRFSPTDPACTHAHSLHIHTQGSRTA